MEPLKKPIRTRSAWQAVRKYYEETGCSLREAAKKFDFPITTTTRRAKAECWGAQKVREAIKGRSLERTIGYDPTMPDYAKAQMIDLEAFRRSEIEKLHRKDPEGLRQILAKIVAEQQSMPKPNIRDVKVLTETIALVQALERKAYRMDEENVKESSDDDKKWIIEIVRPQ
ncbi:MAG: hypothetical protein HQL90_04210 [Magnetococcales bacterium]|nr:hypothetical protein [Magnetococcales bacterium]